MLWASEAAFKQLREPARVAGGALPAGLGALLAGLFRGLWETDKNGLRMLLSLVSPWPVE